MEVRFAARLEDACEALAGNVRRARDARGPLDPVTLWVPSSTVGTFAKMALARALGVAAHIETRDIVKGLADLAGALTPPVRLLDAPLLRGRLLSALHDASLAADPVMAPLVAWVGHGPTAARRRSELAAELANTFAAYLTARPRWLAARLDALARGGITDPAERWQLELLRRVRASTDAVPLPELVAALVKQPLPAEIHVLGWSVLSVGVLGALRRLGVHTRVIVYAPNPSRALWADVSVTRDDLSILLARSGRAHREQIMWLLEASGHDADELPAPVPEATSLLEHAQRCLDDTVDTPWPAGADDSLRVVACPGIRREVEMVAQTIWRLVEESRRREDPPERRLTFDRIAVYYVDREDQPYAAHIDAVLEEAHHIPRRIAHRRLSGETPVVGAVRALLDIPLGGYTRPEVLSVLTHPLVRGRWSDADGDEWLAWCAAVGVVRGDDVGALADSYVEGEPILHWDQGLTRLALGTLAGQRPTEVAGHALLPEPIEGTRARAAGRFVLLARSLLADARWASSAELPLARWIEVLGALVGTYVTPHDEATTAALRACLAAIARLGAVDAGDTPIPYRVAHDLAIEAIDGLMAPGGSELAGGVHVAPLGVGKVVPFDVVFVLGLDAAHFPARAHAGDLDLRPRGAVTGESADIAEQALDAAPDDRDRTAFLEVLLAARRKLILSWESRDAVTGEEKAHSAVISHLLRWIRVVTEAEPPLELLPLRRASEVTEDAFTDGAVPPIAAERRAEALGRLYAEAGGHPDASVRDAIAGAPEDLREDLARALGVVPLPAGGAPEVRDHGAAIDIRLTQLRRFLECPMQGSASFALRLSEDEDDDAISLDEEPLGATPPLALREAFTRGIPDGIEHALEVLGDELRRRKARAESPAGIFGKADAQVGARVLSRWADALDAASFRPLALGAPRAGAGPTWIEPPIEVQTTHGEVHLVGETSLVTRQPRRTLVVQYPRGNGPKYDWRTALRAVLDQIVLTIVDDRAAPHELVLVGVAPDGSVGKRTVVFPAITVEAARRFLTATAEAMLAGPVALLFPIEAVKAFEGGGDLEAVVDEVREDLLSDRPSSPSRYGPVRHPELFPAPTPEVATAIRERLALVLAQIRDAPGGGPR